MVLLRRTRWMMVLLSAWFGSVQVLGQDDLEPELKTILADWEKRRQAVKAVRYELTIKSRFEVSSDRSQRHIEESLRGTFVVDMQCSRHRLEYVAKNTDLPPSVSSTYVGAYDGRYLGVYAHHIQDDGTPILGRSVDDGVFLKAQGNLRTFAFDTRFSPLFFGHGIPIHHARGIVPGQFNERIAADEFVYQGKGHYEGQPVEIVRTHSLRLANSTYDQYWIDAAKDSAVVRYMIYSNNKVSLEWLLQYTQTAAGWLVSRWVERSFRDGRITAEREGTIEKVEIDPRLTDADFEVVRPAYLKKERELVFPKDLGDDGAITKARKIDYEIHDDGSRVEIGQGKGSKNTKRGIWYLALAFVVAVAAAGLLWWRQTIANRRSG